MVFEPWVFRFRVLSASFPNIAYFLFVLKVSFVFEFSVLLINDLFLATTYRVYYDYCALRQFVTVRGIVVSLRYLKKFLYFCLSSIAQGHPSRKFKQNTSTVGSTPVFPNQFVSHLK